MQIQHTKDAFLSYVRDKIEDIAAEEGDGEEEL